MSRRVQQPKSPPPKPSRHQVATDHLRQSDSVMRCIIDEVGPFKLKLERDRFAMLVRSIISQQISTQAAKSIRLRLEHTLAPDGISAESLLDAGIDTLRTAGISPQKAGYLLDLADHAHRGKLNLRTIGRYQDEAIIKQLTQVKGIGRWTAQMFLIFSLGRLDVLPVDDLGVRVAIRDRYGLAELPRPSTCLEIAAPWRPYASIASWYCWRSIDAAKKVRSAADGYPS